MNLFQQDSTTTNRIIFDYKWTIENFTLLYNESHPWKCAICSDHFSPANNEQFRFDLHLYPKGHSKTWKDYLSIGILVYNIPQFCDGKVKCRWDMSIEDANGDWDLTKGIESYILFDDEETIIYNFIKYSSLLNSSFQYLPNNQLTLHFEIYLQAGGPIFNVITNNKAGSSRFDCAQKATTVGHTWTIDNFTDLLDESAVVPYFIQSDNFCALDKQNEQFSMRLYPNGVSGENKSDVDIGTWNCNENNATVHWRISILDADGEESYTQEKPGKIYSNNGKKFKFHRALFLDNSNGLVEDNKLRIYCEMSYVMDNKPKTANNTRILNTVHKSESSIDVAQKTFQFVSHQWAIHKSSALRLNIFEKYMIDSQIFKPPKDPRLGFHLRLWPNGHDEQSKSYISLELRNVSQHTNQVTVQYRISLLDDKGDKLLGWSDQSSISKNEKVRKPKFIKRSDFQEPLIIKQYLSNDKLTIICELWVIQDRKIYKNKSKTKQSNVNSSPTGPAPSVHMSNVNIQGSILNISSTSNIEGNVDLKVESSKQFCVVI